MALIGFVAKAYLRCMRRTFEFGFPESIPSDRSRFLEKDVFRVKWAFKYFKRQLFFWLTSQALFERDHLPRQAGRRLNLLWINLAAPSLGDSLMDLAPRPLLDEFNVDLLTAGKNCQLYARDQWFQRVTKDVGDCARWHRDCKYDFVILDSYSPRVLMQKLRVAFSLPFVGLYGFVNGFEVHRTYFAFARMQFILRLKSPIPKRPVLKVRKNFQTPFQSGYVCLAVGGEWRFRTYRFWADVIQIVNRKHSVNWVLVGSENGRQSALEIEQQLVELCSYVGKLDLMNTAALIKGCKLFIGCDGGLWHIACALDRPSVALFADVALFDGVGRRCMRDTEDMNVKTLYSDTEVSCISPQCIGDLITEQLRDSVCA